MRRRPAPARRSEPERRLPALDQGEQRAVDLLRVLQHDHVPAVLDHHGSAPGSSSGDLAAVLGRRQPVLGAAEDQHLDVGRAPSASPCRGRRTPGRSPRPPRSASPCSSAANRRATAARARRTSTAGPAPAPGRCPGRRVRRDQPGRPAQRRHRAGRGPVQHPAEQRLRAQGTSASLPALVETNATPTTRSREQLGPLVGERHDRHAAHRVADQHDRLGRRDGVEHRRAGRGRSARCRPAPRPVAGPAVTALVPEHQPAVRRASRPAGSASRPGSARSRGRTPRSGSRASRSAAAAASRVEARRPRRAARSPSAATTERAGRAATPYGGARRAASASASVRAGGEPPRRQAERRRRRHAGGAGPSPTRPACRVALTLRRRRTRAAPAARPG